MAGVGRNWKKGLAISVLLMGAGRASFAQSAQRTQVDETGSLAGKLTDLYSSPLAGMGVLLRNEATGTEARTTTTKNGAYLFGGLEPGEYMLVAESPLLGRGQVDEIVVSGGHEAHVQTAMEFEPPPPGPVLPAPQEAIKISAAPTPVLELALEIEPLKTFDLARQSRREPVKPIPSASVLTSTAPASAGAVSSKAGEPVPGPAELALVRLVSHGPAPSGVGPGGVNDALASGRDAALVVGAIRAMLAAATQVAQAHYRPALAASRESDPPAPAVTTATSAAELQALPVSGRHWQDFVLDNTPASTTPAGGQAEISLRGAGQQRAATDVDGVGRGLAFGSTNSSGQGSQGQGPLGQGGDGPAGIGQVGVGGHGLAVSEAAIRAVETAAGNVEAAADRAAGGRMNLETERGGDMLHGQGFLFDRQNTWGAQNPFTRLVKETASATLTTTPVFTLVPYTPPDRETTWGIGAGSQIRRDKLFWFAALDGYRRNDPGLSMVKHPEEFFAQPSNDQMQALASRLGLTSSNPVGAALALYSSSLETLDTLLGPSARTAMQWTGFGRLDWEAAERHRFTLEGIGANWNAPGGGLTRTEETFGNHSFGSTKAGEEWLLGRWEAFVTPNLLAVTQASIGHEIQEARPSTPSDLEKTILAGNAWGQLPQIVVDNRYGFTIGNPSRFGTGSYPDERATQGQESVDWIRGKLLVKTGFNFNHNYDATSMLRNQTGTYTYSNVENFVSDALVFQDFGLSGELDPMNQRNCDQTGKVWRDSTGSPRGVGSLPCYSYYSQTMGPTDWHLSTNDWAGYATTQWQAGKLLVVSAGLRWEREQLPPPLAALQNPVNLPTPRLPSLGNNWGPRVSLAVGTGEGHLPLLRLGYGMYFGRTQNSTVETALTQTGSLKGDVNFFIRPLDGFNPPTDTSNAPPFPYVLQGDPASVIKPGAVGFAPSFHNPEVHQGIASLEERLPGHVEITASALVSLGRRLPVSIDTNLSPVKPLQTITYDVCDQTAPGSGNTACGHTGIGPIKAAQITVPFYASWPSPNGTVGRPNPDYQQITQIVSRANSTYEAGMLRVARHSNRGLSVNAHYTYAHAMDWNPNESSQAAGSDVLDPGDFGLEYGTSNLDMRHSAGAMAIYEAPWKLHGLAGRLGNGWMLSGVGQFRSGLPYTMHTLGSLAMEFLPTINGTETIVGLGPGMNGSGGDNRVYGLGSDHIFYNIGRNTYRYPATWKADLRLAKRFDLGSMRQLELLAESFNLFNYQNVTELETTGYTIGSGSTEGSPPTLNFLTGLKTNTTAFGQPLNVNATNFYRERQLQLGLRMRF